MAGFATSFCRTRSRRREVSERGVGHAPKFYSAQSVELPMSAPGQRTNSATTAPATWQLMSPGSVAGSLLIHSGTASQRILLLRPAQLWRSRRLEPGREPVDFGTIVLLSPREFTVRIWLDSNHLEAVGAEEIAKKGWISMF